MYKMRNVGVSTLVAAALLLAVCVAVVQAEAGVPAPTEFFGGEKDWTLWSAAVTGSVFCDQCLQGKVFPFCHALEGKSLISMNLCISALHGLKYFHYLQSSCYKKTTELLHKRNLVYAMGMQFSVL